MNVQTINKVWVATKGRSWEPPNPKSPTVMKLIEMGYVRRCDMRCGFEAFKNSGLAWTLTGCKAMENFKP